MSMEDKRTAWERLQLIHTKGRPTIKDYIPQIFTDWYEMHGDRLFGDDRAIIGGIARLDGMPVTIIAEVKGRDLNENKACNFAPRGLQKGSQDSKAGGEVPPSDNMLHRHSRSILRSSRRGARTGRGYRKEYRRVHDSENSNSIYRPR